MRVMMMQKRNGDHICGMTGLRVLSPRAHLRICVHRPSWWAVIRSGLADILLRGLLFSAAFVSFTITLRGALNFIFQDF